MKPTDVKSSTYIDLYVQNKSIKNIKTFLQNVKPLIG